MALRFTIPVPIAPRLSAALLAGLSVLPGCAGSGGPQVQPYTLTAEEQGLDCRRLTGRMQVRLLSLRGADYKVAPTGTSATVRSAASSAFMTGTSENAERRAAMDRPVLESYNRRLVELGCPSFDLDKELAARPSAPSPAPTIPASKPPKT